MVFRIAETLFGIHSDIHPFDRYDDVWCTVPSVVVVIISLFFFKPLLLTALTPPSNLSIGIVATMHVRAEQKTSEANDRCKLVQKAIDACNEWTNTTQQLHLLIEEQRNAMQTLESQCKEMVDNIEESTSIVSFCLIPFSSSLSFLFCFWMKKIYFCSWTKALLNNVFPGLSASFFLPLPPINHFAVMWYSY